MKIKEAELLTGLSAKTIRYYESQGLISVKRNSNAYREYSEEDINELQRIKILRKLDASISEIKELYEGKTLLKDILKTQLKELEDSQLKYQLKKSTIELMLKELNKNPNIDLVEYSKGFEYIESDEFNEFIDEIKELGQVSLGSQVIYTLILSGPLLWLFSNIINKKYDFIGVNTIVSIISVILLTLSWNKFLKQSNKKIKGTGNMLLSVLASIVLTLAVFVGISKLQSVIFVPRDYLMFMFKPPYDCLVFFFELEIILFLLSILYKKVKNSELKWTSKFVKFVKKNIAATILVNTILLYMCITAVTVVTENKIIDYSFYYPLGKTYSYSDISKVQVGFKGKLLNTFKKNAGDFYYIVIFNNGKKINFYQANSKFEDTYLELEVFDELIMKTGRAEKVASSDNYEYCDLDERYVNRFLRIIDHR